MTGRTDQDLYRAFWRWHFYAGLVTLPFLAWLAVTGGIYLFKPELERLIYRDWIALSGPGAPQRLDSLIVRVEQQAGGAVTEVARPASASESWRMRVETATGPRTAFVDPVSGKLLGSTSEGGALKTVSDLHSLVITGTVGNALIEIAAGFAIVLVATGMVLWWPRGRQPALALRGPARSRRFWRDLHGSTGAIAAAVILFLAVTGMPWSVFWGAQLQAIVSAQDLGRPPAPGPQPWEHVENGHRDPSAAALPWSLQAREGPSSRGANGHRLREIGPDRAVEIAQGRGLTAPYTLIVPRAPSSPYVVSRTVERAEDARVIYVDAGSGKVLDDIGYRSFGAGAQLIEWGIATHQGQQYGAVNRWVMLAGCVAILILAISAPLLWWKRRLAGTLRPPPMPSDSRKTRLAAGTIVLLGLLYPLTGLALLTVWLFDRAIARRRVRPA